MSSASLGDASLFMDDMDLFALKGEDDASLRSADAMDFPVSSLELVQLLACDDDDIFMDSSVVGDDVFGRHDQQYLAADDLSDAVTDDASSDMAASPPPTFGGDDDAQQLSAPSSPAIYGFVSTASSPSPSVGGSVGAAKPPPQRSLAVKLKLPPTPVSPPAATTSTAPSPMKTNMPSTAAVLPFAFPVACFPPLNSNLKRPLPDVLPNQPAAALDPVEHKKSKRALRQMKNRESANRSRLRRKAQLSDLSSEVDELTKKQHELQNTVAALQAENKSLHDQNAFLRSLVTMYSDPTRAAALPPVPSFVQRPPPQVPLRASVSLCDLESGAPCDDEEDEDDDEDDHELAVLPTPKKQRKSLGRSAATVSAASLGLCASMFGLTILTDSEHGAAQSSHIRRPGRVLHSLPSTAGDQGGCLPSPVAMVVERLWESCSSSWAFLTTSELAYGVFLNVLSFVVIMALYHCFQQHYASSSPRSSKREFRWQKMGPSACHRRGTAAAKRRSVSWQDARVDSEADASTPRVQVFT